MLTASRRAACPARVDIPRPRSFKERESARFVELRHRLLELIFEHERAQA